ncbi:MAG: hypothetical protein IT300_16715 [Dehalococcoidia bacterium]|nr:hypothetical protein [Dehalococcoidia bacterium]
MPSIQPHARRNDWHGAFVKRSRGQLANVAEFMGDEVIDVVTFSRGDAYHVGVVVRFTNRIHRANVP